MSLDVTLIRTYHVTYDGGKTLKEMEDSVYDANITHNLGNMAGKAGIYKAIWRPEEIKCTKAIHVVWMLQEGLDDLKSRPDHFKQFNASNGWGMYKHFVPWVEEYLSACKEYPEARIEVSK